MTAVARLFNDITAAKLESLGDIYSPGIVFQDPLFEVRGLVQLRNVLSRRLDQLHGISVKLLDAQGDDHTGFLLWSSSYPEHGKFREIRGTSHFKFAADGRITEQQDHWDASFPIYGHYPVLGWLMRKIKQRVQLHPEKSQRVALPQTTQKPPQPTS